MLFFDLSYRIKKLLHFAVRLFGIEQPERHPVVPVHRYQLHERMDSLPVLHSHQYVSAVLALIEYFYAVNIKVFDSYLRVMLPYLVPEHIRIFAPASVHHHQSLSVQIIQAQPFFSGKPVMYGHRYAKRFSPDLDPSALSQFQHRVIEYARNVLGLADANSTEMNPQTPHNVIDLMEEQKSISNMGGTMRLGAYDCHLRPGSLAAKAYGSEDISERHRHRFEFNEKYREKFEQAGMQCVGENPRTHLVEVVEVPGKRWYIGTQYHPEYSSTVLNPNPIFLSFMKAAIAYGDERRKQANP